MNATQRKGIELRRCSAVSKVVIRTATMIVWAVLSGSAGGESTISRDSFRPPPQPPHAESPGGGPHSPRHAGRGSAE